MPEKQISAGIIRCNGKILIAQRKHGKDLEFKWEFPGGKLEQGETLEECLHREMLEEMNLEVVVGKLFMRVRYDYPFGTFIINAFWADTASQDIPLICEHERYAWIDPKETPNYDFAPADIPITKALAELDNPFEDAKG